jgi:hypothetical protein
LTIRPLPERSEEGVRDVEDTGEVDRDDVFPVLDDGGIRSCHAITARDARIVDEDRNRADLVGDLLGHRDAVVALGDVERKTLGLAAGVEDLLRRLRRRFLVDVERHHARALPRITGRDGASDAGAGSGDDGDMVGEKRHGHFLS